MYFEFSDAEVSECLWQGSTLQLRFTAARVVGADPLDGAAVRWLPVALQLQGPQVLQAVQAVPLSHCMGRLREGTLRWQGEPQRLRQLPLPGQWQRTGVLELEFAHGLFWAIAAEHWQVSPVQGRAAQCGVEAYQC